jgi:predicted GH43/DUF377 family glycosyl hydrolase
MALHEEDVSRLLEEVEQEFGQRHARLRIRFLRRFEEVRGDYVHATAVSAERQLLIGAYFLAEYSLESAALFNPSIVPHPSQDGVAPGSLRFILSLRATGEGHVSSITFRSGVVDSDNRITLDQPQGLLTEPEQIPNARYETSLFARKLYELGFRSAFVDCVMRRLADSFSMQGLQESVDAEINERSSAGVSDEDRGAANGVLLLARSNYEVRFRPDQHLSARILFPATPSQRNGIEDARFVRFRNEDGTHVYYATFTAFDGRVIVPEFVQTADFLKFRFTTLNGPAAQNKGMALFPRMIGGRYAMLSRQDNESIHIMFSDNVHFWNERRVLLRPQFPWELVQLGNCGSPIETEEGWLVLSHGVGPMRRYCIGAFLLDREDPCKVIGRLSEPLLEPNQREREGYVPNVVYTCGALLHGSELIIPYGLADHATGFATVPVNDVLAAMA